VAHSVQVRRFGKLTAYRLSIVVVSVSGIVTFFTLFAKNAVPFSLALGLMGFGSAGTTIIINIMLSDAIDYDELHTGKRRESTYHVG
jgi:Na+/melibiose symporter-like transporter